MDTLCLNHWVAQCEVTSPCELNMIFIIADVLLPDALAFGNAVILLIEDDLVEIKTPIHLYKAKVKYRDLMVQRFVRGDRILCRVSMGKIN